MRRKDREMDEKFAIDVIDNSAFGVMGLVSDGVPYTVVLSIVRVDDRLYFHSATSGKKVDLIAQNEVVSVSFVSKAKVPSLFSREEIIDLVNEGDFRAIGSKVYTTEYESAHVMGRISMVTDAVEKSDALIAICKKYTPEVYDLAAPFISNSNHRTLVFRIDIDEIHGKRKAFNTSGEELKWGADDDRS